MPIYKPTTVSPSAPLRVRPRVSTEAEAVAAEPQPYNLVKQNFKLLEELGAGEFSNVWRVTDLRNNKECALKIIKRRLSTEVECEMLDKLNKSSGVAPQLYECGTDYILMELIKGKLLKDWIEGHKDEEIPDMLRTFANLIDTIHDAGIVHGDLHLGNIVVTNSGWVAVDFGFASDRDFESWSTIVGALVAITKPLQYPGKIRDNERLVNIYDGITAVKSTSDIRSMADEIEYALKPEPVEIYELNNSLKKLAEAISGHSLEVQNNAVVYPVDKPNVEPPEPDLKNRGEYHITVVSPPELSSAVKHGRIESLEKATELAKDWKISGEPKYVCIGKQEKGDNAVYYIVVDWPEAQEFRKEKFNLDKKDLHITIGYRKSDIHNVPKDKTTCVGEISQGSLTERTFQQELPIDIPQPVIEVLKDIKASGGKGVVIGGSVRDAILGKKAKDIDVEVYGVPGDSLAEILAKHGKVSLVGKQFGVYKTRLNGVEFDIDFSLPRREYKVSTGHKGFDVKPDPSMDYVDAAKRRDFTINTIGYDPLEKTVYDPHGGIEALKKGVIKMTDPGAFKDDPLRVFRMAQFASRFGFDVDPETLRHAKEAPEIETLPSERILEEFKKALLRAKKPSIFLDQLEKSWTIDRLFPEIKGHLEELKKSIDAMADKRSGDSDEDFILMLSAMALVLPWNTATKFIERFVKETDVKDSVKDIYDAVKKAQTGFPGTDAEIRRWLSTINKKNLDALRRVMSVEFGSRGDALCKKADELLPGIDPIIMGRDLQALGVEPGPKMGRLLKQLYNKQLDGEFKDAEGGKALAKDMLSKGTVESSEATLDTDFKMAGDEVSGLKVLKDIPNTGAISSSLTEYEVLKGIREVPFSAFSSLPKLSFYSSSEEEKTKNLAKQIEDSGQIKPLIVVIDKNGPYVLEGGHRFDAFRLLGITSFPALVVLDLESLQKENAGVKMRTEGDVLGLPSLLNAVDTFFENDGGDIIVVDIDGTLMNVSARGVQSLRDAGIEATPENWATISKALKPPNKGKFFKGFLTDKYTNLDTPNDSVFEFVKKLYAETSIPAIILTGRSVSQKGSTEKVGELLSQRGVPVKEVIQKSGPESFMKSAVFKINSIKVRGYNPRFMIDDEEKNLKAFAEVWPEAKLYKVDDNGNVHEYSAPKKGPDNA